MHGQSQCKSIVERLVVLVVQKVLCKHAIYNKILSGYIFNESFLSGFVWSNYSLFYEFPQGIWIDNIFVESTVNKLLEMFLIRRACPSSKTSTVTLSSFEQIFELFDLLV